MKKKLSICLLIALLCTLCACGTAKQPETTACGHEAYADLIARLEAKDFDGARSIIDILENREIPAATEPEKTPGKIAVVPTEPVPPVTDTPYVVTGDFEVVELTKYNVNDYFEFRETYYISARSQCQQYITLKEEYRNRIIALEDVKLDVAYLLCEAHGEADLKAEQFQPEYFEITSQETEVRTLKPDSDGIAWINQMLYFKNGCFPDFAMDVEITYASGKIILQ